MNGLSIIQSDDENAVDAIPIIKYTLTSATTYLLCYIPYMMIAPDSFLSAI